jgi:hypothetical protein
MRARQTVFAVLLLAVAVSLSAMDVGGYVDNTTGGEKAPVGTGTTLQLVQRSSAALWLFTTFGAWTLDAQASYTYTPAVPVLADLDHLVLGGLFPAELGGARSLGFQIGRLPFADATGYVLNHRLDGLKISVGRESSAFSVGVGTTAGLQKPTASVVMSRLDVLSLSDSATVLAPPRLIATFDYQARNLVAGQDLTVGAVVQEDLRSDALLTPEEATAFQPTGGGAMDTQYVSLVLAGGLAPGLFHRTFYTVNTGRTLSYRPDADSVTGFAYRYTPVFGHLAGLELSYFIPQALNSRIRLGGIYSTGDEDASDYYEGNTNETSSAFVPISAASFSDVFTLQPGNSAHVAISYSLRPLSGTGADILQAELSGALYFRTAGGGPVSAGIVDADTAEAYIGSDIDLKVVVQPFSDLRLVLAGGLFLPNEAVMTADNESMDYQFTLQGVIRF